MFRALQWTVLYGWVITKVVHFYFPPHYSHYSFPHCPLPPPRNIVHRPRTWVAGLRCNVWMYIPGVDRLNVTSEGLFIDNTGHLKRLLCVTKCSVPILLSVLNLCSPKHRRILCGDEQNPKPRAVPRFFFSLHVFTRRECGVPRVRWRNCEGLLTFFFPSWKKMVPG